MPTSAQVGDTVGVFLDTNDRTIVFSLNGELLVDPSAGDAAFTEIQGEEFVPACTLGIGQKCRAVRRTKQHFRSSLNQIL